MSPRNNDDVERTNNLDDPASPVESKSVPYLSPPSSPSKNTGISVDKARAFEPFSSHLPSPPSSPPPQSLELKVDENQAEEEAIDATTLKTLLGLTNGRCGAPAKTGRPCGLWSPAAKKAAAASQLASMITLTQSSVDLADQLIKLASLVHCKHHDGGLPLKYRVEAWTKTFPIGEITHIDPIILVEKKIVQLLAVKSAECLRVVDDIPTKCDQGIGGLRVSHCTLTINEIITTRAYLSDSHLEVLLQVLERSRYCPQHRKEKNLQNVASWKSIIAGFLINLPKKEAFEENEDPREDSDIRSTPENPSNNESDGLILTSANLSTPGFDQDLSAYWPVTYNTAPFEIVVRSNDLADYRSSYNRINRVVERPLATADLRRGYIYMYEVEGNPGFVKIGYTATRTVDQRLEEWEFECNRVSKALYPIPSSTAESVPHARRIEALCHAELDHRRIRIYCHGCLKQHLEWFEISSTEAIAVIQKWTNWMKTEPYEPKEFRNGQKWIIKTKEMARTERMNDFMADLSTTTDRDIAAK